MYDLKINLPSNKGENDALRVWCCTRRENFQTEYNRLQLYHVSVVYVYWYETIN